MTNTRVIKQKSPHAVFSYVLKGDEANAINKLTRKDINFSLSDTNESLIHLAAERGFNKLVKQLLEYGADPYRLNKNNENALSLAITPGHSQVIELVLIANNAEVTTNIGAAIITSVKKNDTGLTKRLCEKAGKKVTTLALKIWSSGADTALHLAVKNGNQDLVKLLMDFGADPYQLSTTDKNSIINKKAFQIACEQRDDTIAIAMASHTNFSPPNNYKEVIFRSIEYGKIKLASALLASAKKKGHEGFGLNSIKIQETEITSLHIAAERGDAEAVKLLLSYGANPYQRNKCKENALSLAVTEGHSQVIELILIASNAEVTTDIGAAIINSVKKNDTGLTKRLCEKAGKKVTTLALKMWSYAGDTSLHIAAERGNAEAVKLLISYGANPYQLNKDKENALSLAITEDHRQVIEAIIASNAEVTTDIGTAILNSVKRNDTGLTKRLCEKAGKKITTIALKIWSYGGDTALQIAEKNDNPELVNLLMDFEAELSFVTTVVSKIGLFGQQPSSQINNTAPANRMLARKLDELDRFSNAASMHQHL